MGGWRTCGGRGASHLLFSRSRYSRGARRGCSPFRGGRRLGAGDRGRPVRTCLCVLESLRVRPRLSGGVPRAAHGAQISSDGGSTWSDPRALLPAQPPSSTTSIVVDPEFLKDEGCIETSPMERIRRPRLLPAEERDVVTVSDDEVARMFSACEDWQELLTIAVLAYLGPSDAPRRRCASGTSTSSGTMRFQEKGKVVVKPMPDELVAILRAAWESSEVAVGPDEYVIPNRRPASVRGRALTEGDLGDRAPCRGSRQVRSRSRVARGVRRSVRRSSSRPAPRAQADLLGHARLETTLVYLRRRRSSSRWSACATFHGERRRLRVTAECSRGAYGIRPCYRRERAAS